LIHLKEDIMATVIRFDEEALREIVAAEVIRRFNHETEEVIVESGSSVTVTLGKKLLQLNLGNGCSVL
jgi:hypothetical protein